MKLTSPVFNNNDKIPPRYTCEGENINPPLAISGVPAQAASLALVMDDPDAPGGSFIHWLVWNIDAKTDLFEENSAVSGSVSGRNSFGRPEYSGPCPPGGIHHYIFKLLALDCRLDLPAGTDGRGFQAAISGHILETAILADRYARN